ncbi:DUF4838 domain-containing protein [Puniceicoccales bacterium CK1056]|uniref:DUF4838 domain-containing protein n=1 Tax=Oceanipulchritudo coccoides TaxID=2706888 RepID=A0A6B2M3F6_9BACT|nr:DUF4838 domain-containing protein [Oceanipulchritudo coccoides]NDV62345.1 DUF4838 domain-containing protein [Oceanipulchritudo coccoides]
MRSGIALFLATVAAGSLDARLPDGYETLYLSPHASNEVKEAAGELAQLMEQQFGTAPKVARLPMWGARNGIIIGPDANHEAFDENPLTDEVRVARTRHGLEITGSDNPSTCFAVFRFAEQFLGWRYYQPGETGLERLDSPPEAPSVQGADEVLLFERPSYLSRNPYSLGRAQEGPDWGSWHGLRERFYYNHTLHRVLPPTEFDRHPEWFAKDENGKPMRPPYYPKVHGYNDHPDLSRPEVRQWAIEATLDAIEAATSFQRSGTKVTSTYPPVRQSRGVLSVSASLGDSFVFGHFGEDYPWKPEGYFRRWPDWSNHVFAYSNAVAEGIEHGLQQGTWKSQSRPDLYIGTLAYLNWENVPDFPIHPSIVPYLTFDRSQWYDEAAKADDLQNVEAWNKTAAPFLGTWDYLFGYGFIIPRSMTEIVSESIPALHERGVRAYFCQIAAIWPYDGHTNWLLARLLWDVDSDPSDLLDEYFTEFYGPAAEPMRAFFAHAEKLWMEQPGSGWWLRHWKDPWQAGLWKQEDLALCRNLLEEALEKAKSFQRVESGLQANRFAKRIEPTRQLFAFTEAFHEYQSLCWKLQGNDWDSASREALLTGIQTAKAASEARSRMITLRDKAVRTFPLAARASDLQWVFRYDSLGANMAALLTNLVSRFQEEQASKITEALLSDWTTSQGIQWDPGREIKPVQVLNDRSFEHVENPRIWHRQFMDSEGIVQKARKNPNGFIAGNVRRGHLYQLFAATPGNYYLGKVDVETRQSLTGEVYIRIDFFNKEHALLAESPRARIAPVEMAGTRQTVRALMQAPPDAAYGRLFIRFYEMDPGSEAVLNSASVLQLKSRVP